jgi:hypothetical protein
MERVLACATERQNPVASGKRQRREGGSPLAKLAGAASTASQRLSFTQAAPD